MKNLYLLILIYVFNCFDTFSQCVSIELSVKWERGVNILQNDSDTICIPYLNITYRNNSSDSLYFLKVSESRIGLPRITNTLLMNTDLSLYEQAIRFLNYSEDEFIVYFAFFNYHTPGFSIINDTVKKNEEEEDADVVVQHDLSKIYEYIYQSNNKESETDDSFSTEYKTSDITENGILSTVRSSFVFLKGYEEYTEQFNLIGFLIVGGHFEFLIQGDKLYDFVYGNSKWDENKKSWFYEEMYLPKKVKGYNLYAGPFLSNSIALTFKGQQSKK